MAYSLDLKEYEAVAGTSGVFKGVEIDLMTEILSDWQKNPGKPYTLLELRDGKTLVAFAIIYQETGKNFTFDIRFIALDRDYRSGSAIHHIFQLIDEELLKKMPFAVIHYEISTVKRDSLGAQALEAAGYCQIGHISSFYGERDDYYFYIKAIFRKQPNFITISRPFEDEPPLDITLEQSHS